MLIHCCQCESLTKAVLITGLEAYPHRSDLKSLPFWKCPKCNNFVGCHHKTKNRTKPLGCIPTKEIKEIRKVIHSILDPMWRDGYYKRAEIYGLISKEIGFNYHTASLKTVDECNKALKIISKLEDELHEKVLADMGVER